jgi:hypothetical protein
MIEAPAKLQAERQQPSQHMIWMRLDTKHIVDVRISRHLKRISLYIVNRCGFVTYLKKAT